MAWEGLIGESRKGLSDSEEFGIFLGRDKGEL